MTTEEELLAKAEAPSKEAMRLHPFYRGKVQMVPKCIVRDISDFDIWYSPGVAEPCMDISRNPNKVYEHTNKGNTVAVITDGTRVLGLGDIGPEASLPVMEGKALIYKYLGGVLTHRGCSFLMQPIIGKVGGVLMLAEVTPTSNRAALAPNPLVDAILSLLPVQGAM